MDDDQQAHLVRKIKKSFKANNSNKKKTNKLLRKKKKKVRYFNCDQKGYIKKKLS